jgi:hypothetical protein
MSRYKILKGEIVPNKLKVTRGEKIKNYLEPDVLELCNQINRLSDKYFDKLETLNENSLSLEETKLLKNIEYLVALGLISEFENIEEHQARGLTAVYDSATGPIKELKSSGEESACLKLWSGTDEYKEQFETKCEIINHKSKEIAHGTD